MRSEIIFIVHPMQPQTDRRSCLFAFEIKCQQDIAHKGATTERSSLLSVFDTHHSYRKATIGLTLVAARDGKNAANIAIARNSIDIPANDNISIASKP